MSIFILIIVAIVAIALVFFLFTRKEPDSSTSSLVLADANAPFMSTEEAAAVVNHLETLGYYKYADPGNIDILKKDLIEMIGRYGILSTVDDDKTFAPLDVRYYGFDGETLFEQDGFTDKLEEMKPLFDKMGLVIRITGHIEECGSPGGYLDHSIAINGKNYIIFAGFEGYGWGEAAQRFAEIINDQLTLQQKDERLYLINGANDGLAIFLTDTQFSFLDNLLKDELWKPLTVENWCTVFKVDPRKYNKNSYQ